MKRRWCLGNQLREALLERSMQPWHQIPVQSTVRSSYQLVCGVSYVAQADILDQLRVNVHLSPDLLEDLEDHAIERRIFQTTLPAFGERRSDGQCNDYIVGVLGGAVQDRLSATSSPWIPEAGILIRDS